MKIKDLQKSNDAQGVYPNAGHRKRLRERFLQSGLDGFHDYEIVELLLTLGTPMKDCKQMAKEAIQNFKGLKGKINFCLGSSIFGKSVLEALKKLDNSTKITGDIVAHDSNILLSKNDIELAIIPFRVLLTDIF